MKLDEFLARLDRHEHQVPIDELVGLMRRLDVDCSDVAGSIRFDEAHYARNLLHAGPGYAALVLCWAPGQRSPIHDHRGSACGVRVLEGIATETRYARGADGMLRRGEVVTCPAGFVCGSYDADIHVIANEAADGTGLVTLHVYTPPLQTFNLYTLDSPEVELWSDPLTVEVRRRFPMSRESKFASR